MDAGGFIIVVFDIAIAKRLRSHVRIYVNQVSALLKHLMDINSMIVLIMLVYLRGKHAYLTLKIVP